MATDWTAEQLSVYQDLEAEGFEITVRTPGSPGDYDENTRGYWGSTADTDSTTYALKKKYNVSQIDGDVVQQNDSKLLFPAYGLNDVDTNKKILIDGVEQNVVNIGVVDPGNVPLLYEVQVRG